MRLPSLLPVVQSVGLVTSGRTWSKGRTTQIPLNPGNEKSLTYAGQRQVRIPSYERINTSYIASAGIAQPLRPSCRLSSFEPRINPTTEPLSSSTIGPPDDPAVGIGMNDMWASVS